MLSLQHHIHPHHHHHHHHHCNLQQPHLQQLQCQVGHHQQCPLSPHLASLDDLHLVRLVAQCPYYPLHSWSPLSICKSKKNQLKYVTHLPDELLCDPLAVSNLKLEKKFQQISEITTKYAA